ncbi:MAG: magnesium transporter MgtE N-terminal domain-containing protein [Armatimonadota bacterium]
MLFLAHMLNRPVFDADGVRLGWVEDLVLSGLDLFPTVQAIVLARRGKGAAFLPWDVVDRIEDHAVVLTARRAQLPTSPLSDDAVFLRRDILDKQVVDIHGRKIVRINDLQLAPIDNKLRLIGADIGARGLLRRLKVEAPVAGLARRLNAPLPERVIPWNYVEGLETEWPSIRLNVSRRRLRELPPTDIADIVTQLNPDEREELLLRIDDATLADTLPHLEDDMQVEVIDAMSDERASDILEILPPDEAADVLGDIAEERAERLLNLMEPDEADDLRELLRYADDTAGGRMTNEFIAISDKLTVERCLAELRRQSPDAETIYYIYVTDIDGRLEGVLSLRDLLTSEDDLPVTELVRRDVVRAHVDDDQETVAHLLNRYHFLAVPVVDDDGVLRGVVTADDVLDVLHEEAEEDVSRLAGATEMSDVLATPWEQAWLRLPWLLGATLAGILVAFFLTTQLATAGNPLPMFAVLPILLLLAVQIGGQGAATTQVALGEGESLREIIARHLRFQWPLGIGISLLAAVAGGAFTYWFDAGGRVLEVGIIIWGVLMVDMLVGSLLPVLLARLRWDPVLVSRPALAVLALVLGAPLLAHAL